MKTKKEKTKEPKTKPKKGGDVTTQGNPTCPVGYYWDVTTGSCIKDRG